MKIANYHSPAQQEFPSIPQPFFDWLRTTFRQVDDLTGILQGGGSLTENGNNEIVEIKARQGTEYEVTLSTLNGQPKGAFVIFCQEYIHPSLKLDILDEGKIRVKLTWPTDPGKEILTRILVIGG